MSLNVEYSIKYMFKDSDWKKKFLIGAFFMTGMVIMNVLSKVSNIISDMKPEQLKPYMHYMPEFLAIFGILFLIGTILNIFSTGYFAKNINLRVFKPESGLLEWENWSNMFAVGFKASAAILIYCLFFGIMLFVPIFVFILLSAALSKAFMIAVTLMCLALVFAASIAFALYLAAASLAFNTDLKFSSYFNFSLIKKLMTKNFFNFFVYVLLIFAVSVLGNIINSVLMITVFGIVLMPFVLFYTFMVQNDLASQFIRNTLELPVNQD